jgi:hypothetical protein
MNSVCFSSVEVLSPAMVLGSPGTMVVPVAPGTVGLAALRNVGTAAATLPPAKGSDALLIDGFVGCE